MSESLLAEAIRNMGNADLLRAFENPKWGRGARALIRAEILLRLNGASTSAVVAGAIGAYAFDMSQRLAKRKGKRRVAAPG